METRNQKPETRNYIETTLYEGIALVSMLLRLGHYNEAASLASQLLTYFPQALPLHVGVGRALLAVSREGQQQQNLRAIGHFRRVLDSDPENWRVRLETVLLYLRGDALQRERAGHELWLAAQSAPDNRWLREMIERLPDHPFFQRTRQWSQHLNRKGEVSSPDAAPNSTPAAPSGANLTPPGDDEGGLARLYLRRRMPWMAVQYFQTAMRRLSNNAVEGQSRADLKTGLLLALWLNGDAKQASALASEMLLDQPQLILPRLLLTSHLSGTVLRNDPEALINLIEPVWRLDPFLERSTELAYNAGLDLPADLWPRPELGSNYVFSTYTKWQKLGFMHPVRLRLGNLDRAWLESLIEASRQQETRALANGGMQRIYHPHSEVSFSLSELDGTLVDVKPGSPPATPVRSQFIMPKGRQESSSRHPAHTEIEKIAASIAEVENLLYGPARLRRPPRSGKPTKKSGPSSGHTPKGGAGSDAPAQNESPKANPTIYRINGAQANRTPDDSSSLIPHPSSLRQATALVVTSERALTSKYGVEGFRKIQALLIQLIEAQRNNGFDARLLVVDSAEALKKHGFERLDPVHAFVPEQVRALINAALPGETAGPPSAYPNTVFIIGGPDIIPFWRIPNPSFDSDREVLSDNPYGARDQTYLLPERIVGRLPDDSGPAGDVKLEFLLNRLQETIRRHQSAVLPHSAISALPMRLIEAILPNPVRNTLLGADAALGFEEEWLHSALAGSDPLLDKNRAAQLAPFVYSAEAWKQSTETLRNSMGITSPLLLSPPTRVADFSGNGQSAQQLQRARLLHFNLHGFKDTPNWYGQSHASRLVTSPSLSSLPLAFSPALTGQVQTAGTVVFSEACYGGYLAGKGVEESVALSLLAQGSAVFIGSTVISYGSAGPELSCAGHLSYYFWKEALMNGTSFGRAFQLAKTHYARERLAAGYNLTGDDAKTLLEFVLLGDPALGLRGVSPMVFKPATDFLANGAAGSSQNVMKGGLFSALGNLEKEWEEFQTVRGVVRRLWGRFTQPKAQYQPVQYNKLPPDLKERIEKILAWLLPDPLPHEGEVLQTLIDMGNGYLEQRGNSGGRPGTRHQKGGNSSAFADWFTEDEPEGANHNYQHSEARLLLSGQRPLQTADGRSYQQTFHLSTDITGDQIDVNLSKGKG